jgi:hypothetical protein
MADDFEVISRPFVPVWRRKRTKQRFVTEVVMALASATGLLLVWAPWRNSGHLTTAISLQLSQGDAVAGVLFSFMGIVLLLMAARLWRAQRKASALMMATEVAALACLAFTDPYSTDHLITFAAVAVASAGWLVVLALDLEDQWLSLIASAGIVALALVPFNLGLGERALITSCLVGMNLMFFRHFD